MAALVDHVCYNYLPCGVFDRLRSREWLNFWDIAAALEMTDRPEFMRLGPSAPLYKKDAPAGRPLYEYQSVRELLEALRDAIRGHRSLFEDGKILHRDIYLRE
ncbi:hypothetical protein ACMFMF_000183 [Clarireedia jacksonii]